ncbi:MAG: hypothetical protein H7329_19985, partial [Opitutaceae bacterium]|nr:hypothetical protein [Cytophagales bacterium]
MRQRLIFSAIITIFLSGNIAVLGQCPIPPASITTTISTNNSGTYSLTSNQSLLISGGNFTGKINSVSGSAVIYISPGATFAPTVLGNFLGKIINCGTAILPSFTIGGPSVGIENYNKWTFTGTIGSNEKSYWINGISSKMIFQQSVSMNNVTFTNKGSAKFHGFFTMNAGVNSLVNEDSIIAESINLNSSLNNSGILNSTVGSITLNGVSNTYNNCIIKSNDSFNFSGTDTLINSGTLMLHENNSGVLKFQAKAFKNKSIGFVQGPNFENNGTSVLGSGNFRFTGNTRNQGQFGSDGLGINFYDVSLNSPGIFDVQNIQPHSSVTKISIAKIDTTFFPSTCSNVLKNEVCGQATPITFSSTSPICVGGQSQIVIKGLEAGRKIQAYIGNDSLSSVLTGTGGNLVISLSTYQLKIGYNKITFRLKTAKCGDIYLADSNNIIVNAPPQINLSVIGDTVCQGFPAQVKILQSGTSVNYELFEGAVAISPVTMGN